MVLAPTRAKRIVADVWIPIAVRKLTGGRDRVQASGSTVRQIITSLEFNYPGMESALTMEGEIVPGIVAIIDGEVAYMGMLERVNEGSEVHFLPAIGGGQL